MRSLLFILTWVIALEASAQGDTVRMIMYTPDYRFNEGLFLTFDQVKTNNPLPKTRILTTVDYNDRDFFTTVFSEEPIYYYDDFGMKKELKSEDVWGYSQNGVLYVGLGGDFHRVTIIGGICHFIAAITSYDGSYYDPYFDRFSYYDYYYRRPNTVTKTEVRQFLIDFETGEVVDYNIQNLEVILMKDPELYDEYNSLGRRKKKQMKFLYIRKYNERNAIYLPAL